MRRGAARRWCPAPRSASTGSSRSSTRATRRSPCYHCLFGEGDELEETRCATMGVFAPLVGIVGATQAAEALKLIAGVGEIARRPPAAGRRARPLLARACACRAIPRAPSVRRARRQSRDASRRQPLPGAAQAATSPERASRASWPPTPRPPERAPRDRTTRAPPEVDCPCRAFEGAALHRGQLLLRRSSADPPQPCAGPAARRRCAGSTWRRAGRRALPRRMARGRTLSGGVGSFAAQAVHPGAPRTARGSAIGGRESRPARPDRRARAARATASHRSSAPRFQ